jgi:hypothetical protein
VASVWTSIWHFGAKNHDFEAKSAVFMHDFDGFSVLLVRKTHKMIVILKTF